MYVAQGRVHYTPSDFATYAGCAYSALQRLDVALGRVEVARQPPDPLRERIGELGEAHEQQVLERYREHYGDAVRTIGRPTRSDGYPAAAQRTIDAMTTGTSVIYQAPIAHGRLYGVLDFLVRYADRWQLVEAKLAHRVKAAARVQIGAYAQMLIGLGVPLEADALVHLGNGSSDVVPIIDVLQETTTLRREFEAELDAAVRNGPVRWGQPGLRICGWCDGCREAAHLARDVRTVAGLKMDNRPALVAAGISTIDQLAASTGPVEGLESERLETFRAQARLQVEALPPGAERDPSLAGPVAFEVRDRGPIDRLPPPSEGDLFFDFESDPMWRADGDGSVDGLEYLFGMWVPERAGEEYVAFWAHDRAEERRALQEFLAYVQAAIARDRDLHIYHYSSYEPNVLLRAARRHETGTETVQRLIDGDYFVDLLPVVRGSLRTSQDGFGLKKIEPLYMGDETRGGDVVDAAASVVGYQRYVELRDAGRIADARQVLAAIEAYNRYDCLSTLRLRDWLRSLPEPA